MGEFWLTPPDLYEKLDKEFKFDFDPCPYPKPDGYNSILSPWGKSNYVNPPFRRQDGVGPPPLLCVKQLRNSKKEMTLSL